MNPFFIPVITFVVVVATFFGGFALAGWLYGDDDSGGAMVWVVAAVCIVEALAGTVWFLYSLFRWLFG